MHENIFFKQINRGVFVGRTDVVKTCRIDIGIDIGDLVSRIANIVTGINRVMQLSRVRMKPSQHVIVVQTDLIV